MSPSSLSSQGKGTSTPRIASINRETSETQVNLTINLDGTGQSSVATGSGFLDHMLTLASAHGFFDLSLAAQGDTHVDLHHLVEDVGISMGQAVDQALGDRAGIRRFANVALPMDEALVSAALDISGRSCLVFNVPLEKDKVGELDTEVIEEFFAAFARNARVTLHFNLLYGRNTHHILEAVFKAFGRVLGEAASLDPRRAGVPSTKGII